MTSLGFCFPSWWHNEYSSTQASESLERLAETGARIVAIIPTWYMENLSSNSICRREQKTAKDMGVLDICRQAKRLGLQLLLKPHVDVPGKSRTELDPSNPQEWFKAYKMFITHYAQLAADVQAEYFCIGTELKRLSGNGFAKEWTDIIKACKKSTGGPYDGPLTYAANHDEYESVSFWDHLDYIGVDAYFDTRLDGDASMKKLESAFQTHAEAVQRFAEQKKKDVILTEIGFRNTLKPYENPWSDKALPVCSSGEPQAICYEAAIRAWTSQSRIKHVLFWAWSPNLAKEITGNPATTGYCVYQLPAAKKFMQKAVHLPSMDVSCTM